MPLTDFLSDLQALQDDAAQAFAAAASPAALEEARIEFLGAKSGRLKAVQKGLGGVGKDDKPLAGKRFNEVKQAIEAAFADLETRLASSGAAKHAATQFDVTLPGKRLRIGRLHPISQTIDELKDIMGRLGFSAVDGPEIEDERHNFNALNIPLEHPARDPLDNFYLSVAQRAFREGEAPAEPGAASKAGQLNSSPPSPNAARQEPRPPSVGSAPDTLLLRSQTSTVQIRVMEQTAPPIRIISLGRVYRPDTADATHYPMFHQMEGLLIDRKATMADLKSVLRLFATSYLGKDVHVRFRPSFFPFTEPSVEVDMHWNDRWMEFGGAGMVDPNVLREVGYDPEEVSGFAFGLGVERLCMRRHGVTDIRDLYRNDVRFLEQF